MLLNNNLISVYIAIAIIILLLYFYGSDTADVILIGLFSSIAGGLIVSAFRHASM